MAESSTVAGKSKDLEKTEAEAPITSRDHPGKRKGALTDDEQASKFHKRAKQERKEARAERRLQKALRREKRGRPIEEPEVSANSSVAHQEPSNSCTSGSCPDEDDLPKKDNHKEATSSLAKPRQVSVVAEASESRSAAPKSPNSNVQLNTRTKRQQNGHTMAEMRNAEASSSTPSNACALLEVKSKEAKQKKIDAMGHEELLASVWLTAGQIKEKVETEGMIVKTGIFSTMEKAQIRQFLIQYKALRHLTEQQLADMINANGKKAREQFGDFWKEVAASVPGRSLRAVHAHLKRAYEPGSRKGPWTLAEDEDLKSAYLEFGAQWRKVSLRVDRASQDCKDRWRNYVSHQDTRVSGAWSAEESDQLRKCVTELGALFGKSLEDTANGIQWSVIASKMNNTRSPAQCRIKWTDEILPGMLSNKKAKWNGTDTIQMVKRILSQNPRDRSEVNWNALPYAEWNHMSGHRCLKNFGKLVQKIPGAQQMDFRGLLDELLKQGRRAEKDHMSRSLAKRQDTLQQAKHTSTAMVAAELANQSRYKSKEFVIDSDPDATDIET